MSCRDKWNMHILPFQLCIRFYSRYHRIISEILFSNDIKRIRNAAKMLTSIYTQISKRLSAFLVFRHEIINVRYLKVDQAWFSKWQVNVRFWGGLFLQKDGYSIVFYDKNYPNEQQSASKSFFLYKTMNRVDEYWIYSQVFASLSHKIILLNNATPIGMNWRNGTCGTTDWVVKIIKVKSPKHNVNEFLLLWRSKAILSLILSICPGG